MDVGQFLRPYRQPEAVHQTAAMFENLLHLFRRAAGRGNVGDRVVEHRPTDFRGNDTVAGLGKSEILSGEDGSGEDVDHDVPHHDDGPDEKAAGPIRS